LPKIVAFRDWLLTEVAADRQRLAAAKWAAEQSELFQSSSLGILKRAERWSLWGAALLPANLPGGSGVSPTTRTGTRAAPCSAGRPDYPLN